MTPSVSVFKNLRAFAFATSVLAFSTAAQAVPYTLTILPDLGGGADMSQAWGVNNNGQVVGFSSSITGTRAFIWDATNGMLDLGDLAGGANFSEARGINNLGQVVGTSGASTGDRAFIWDPVNGMVNIGDLPGGINASSGQGINDNGQVVGYGNGTDGNATQRGFIWTNGTFQAISRPPGTPSDKASNAFGVNDFGQVVGSSPVTSTEAAQRAYIWNNPTATNLGDFSGGDIDSRAFDVNNNGVVVGYGTSGSGRRAFMWNGTLNSLGVLPGGANSNARAINDSNVIVGNADAAGPEGQHAFIWDSLGGMIDLNTLIDPSAFTLTAATAISNTGLIAGYGLDTISGATRAFLLSAYVEPPPPEDVPTPGALAIFALGLFSLTALRRKGAASKAA